MQIKRDYSEPFFAAGRRRRNPIRSLIYMLAVTSAIVLIVYLNYDSLQSTALNALGTAPTATPLPSELAMQAANLALVGNQVEAAEIWENVVRQRPDNINYLYEYGLLLVDSGDYDVALQLGDRIIDLDLSDPRGHALKATALVFSGSSSAAIPVAVTGIDFDPAYAPLHSALARAYVGTARYADAVESGFTGVELAPYSADARRAYAYALNWFGENLEATSQLEQAVALDPNRIPTYFELAFQYLAQNRDQEAIDIYTQILAIQPRNARAMLRLCTAYRKVGEFQRALGQCADAADAADPQEDIYAEVQLEYGRMLYNELDFAGALQAFERCAEAAPDSLSCNYYQGLSHFYLGDCDNAWAILRDALTVARARSGTEGAVEDIQAGVVAITQTCPQYQGLAGSLDIDTSLPPAGDVGGS